MGRWGTRVPRSSKQRWYMKMWSLRRYSTRFARTSPRQISLHPEVAALLLKLRSDEAVVTLIVTCGRCQVWQKVLERYGLGTVKVIGSGPLSGTHTHIVTPQTKARLVAHLQRSHRLHVVAVGDSVLDLGMSVQTERAIVVFGDEQTRNRRMEEELAKSLESGALSAKQTVLARGSPPRLTTRVLPLVDLNGSDFYEHILRRSSLGLVLNIIHFTDARLFKILATPMRDAAISGPELRDAHWQVGRYLALSTLPDLLGIEEYKIQHVQGHQVPGHRIAGQGRVLIVALMRGCEPMALGVSEILPMAPFVHAREPEDVKPELLDLMSTIILVDSVVNSGQTVVGFIRHLAGLSTGIRIVIMAGVVQKDAIVRIEA